MKNSNRCNLMMTNQKNSNDLDNNRDANIMMTMLILDNSPRMGRDKLAERIGVGRGYIRTVLNKLSASGLTDTFQTGCTLNSTGRAVMSHIPIKLLDDIEYICPAGAVQKAVLLKGASNSVTTGMYQRDMALVGGGYGCITFVYTGGNLMMPPDTDISEYDPALYKKIMSSIQLENGDIIIIGEGIDEPTALRSAINAAMHSMSVPCIPAA